MIAVCPAVLSMKDLNGHRPKLPDNLTPILLATTSVSSFVSFKGESKTYTSLTELTTLSTEHTVSSLQPGGQGSSVLSPTQKHNAHTEPVQQPRQAGSPGSAPSKPVGPTFLLAMNCTSYLYFSLDHGMFGPGIQYDSFSNHWLVNPLDTLPSEGY